MNILLTGASGFIGQHLTLRLNRTGHKVHKISRRSGYDFNTLLSEDDWLPLLNDIDTVINCVGIIAETSRQTFNTLHTRAPIALFKACVTARVKRVIQLSALGADEHAVTPYQLSKKAADDALRSLPLHWFVLRPSLVYGKGGASSTLFKRLSACPVLPLIEGGHQQIQPVHIDDLTETILNCLSSKQSCITLNIVGAEPVTLRNWLQLMRSLAGKSPANIIPIPRNLGMLIAKPASLVLPLISTDNLRMLLQGNVAEVTPMV